jgi:hypothetical protein
MKGIKNSLNLSPKILIKVIKVKVHIINEAIMFITTFC